MNGSSKGCCFLADAKFMKDLIPLALAVRNNRRDSSLVSKCGSSAPPLVVLESRIGSLLARSTGLPTFRDQV